MMVFYVCVYSEAREANEREKKNFLFFVKRETKRRKNIKNGSQKRKNSKILFFLRFFCSSLDRRPKHLQILGHLHAHRYSIHFFSKNLFVFCEVILYTQRTQKHAEQKREGERNLLAFFLSSSVTVLLLCRLDGERERVILNFRSFVRCFPIASSSSRDETRERQCY